MPGLAARLTILALLWGGYCAVHSLLASRSAKTWVRRRLPALAPSYRILYNLVALGTIAPLIVLTLRWRGPWLWRWSGAWNWIAEGLAIVALTLFFWTWLHYDMRHFFGVRQLRDGISNHEPAPFRISALHRHVRHPWYTLTLVALWTRDMEPARLIAVVVVHLYLVVGSRIEERKLLDEHPRVFPEYRRRVPALLPRPWRNLSRAEADRLLQRAR